jgi:hypothetical protein
MLGNARQPVALTRPAVNGIRVRWRADLASAGERTRVHRGFRIVPGHGESTGTTAAPGRPAARGCVDGGVAVAALATSVVEALPPVGAVVAATGLLALAGRRRRPLTAAASVVAVVVVEVVAAPRAARRRPSSPRWSRATRWAHTPGGGRFASGLVLATAGVGVAQVLAPNAGFSHLTAISFFAPVLVLAPAGIGLLVRAGRSIAGRVRVTAATIRAEVPERIAGERAVQRARVGADIERLMLSGLERTRPHAAAGDFTAVVALRELGRDVLGRRRALLAELREADQTPDSPHAPGQGLVELRTQIDRVLAAGAAAGARAPAAGGVGRLPGHDAARRGGRRCGALE